MGLIEGCNRFGNKSANKLPVFDRLKETKLDMDKCCKWHGGEATALKTASFAAIHCSLRCMDFPPLIKEFLHFSKNSIWKSGRPWIGDNGRMVKMMQLDKMCTISGKKENLRTCPYDDDVHFVPSVKDYSHVQYNCCTCGVFGCISVGLV